MSIDTMKTINNYKGQINVRYSMRVSDMCAIEEASDDLFDIISNAFTFGYAQGAKATRKELAR